MSRNLKEMYVGWFNVVQVSVCNVLSCLTFFFKLFEFSTGSSFKPSIFLSVSRSFPFEKSAKNDFIFYGDEAYLVQDVCYS